MIDLWFLFVICIVVMVCVGDVSVVEVVILVFVWFEVVNFKINVVVDYCFEEML